MVRKFALYFGIVYLAVGILGFISPIGGSYTQDTKQFLGLFGINFLHNIVHLVIGVVGIAASGSVTNATNYAKVFGGVLIAVAVVGFLAQVANIGAFRSGGFLPLDGLDILLHLATGALGAYFGFMAREEAVAARA